MINIIKGDHDPREFRYIKLENEMRVLLVSEGGSYEDAGEAKEDASAALTNSAACMFVSVGSL